MVSVTQRYIKSIYNLKEIDILKHKFEEKYSVNICGVYNATDMTIEVDEKTYELEEILKKVDGMCVKFSISKTDEIG